MLKELPETLEVGMKLTCPASPLAETLTVFKADRDNGRIWFMHENGLAGTDTLTRWILYVMGYKLIEGDD